MSKRTPITKAEAAEIRTHAFAIAARTALRAADGKLTPQETVETIADLAELVAHLVAALTSADAGAFLHALADDPAAPPRRDRAKRRARAKAAQ